MMDHLISVSITAFVFVFGAYVLTILKEKIYLNNNVIFLDHGDLKQEDLEHLDIKHFMLGSTEIMVGDEVKIMLEDNHKVTGTVLGANKSNNTIAIITKERDVEKLSIRSIRKLKVISRYGKFFTRF